MKNTLIIYFLFFLIITLKAQDKVCPCDSALKETFPVNLKGSVYHRLEDLTGEEFYNKSYSVGNIFLEDGRISHNQKIKYNGRIDGLIFLPQDSYKEIVLDKYFIKGFSYQNRSNADTLLFSKIRVADGSRRDSVDVFGQVLYQGKLSLFVQRRYVYEQDIQDNSGQRIVFKKLYSPSFVYYFKLPNNKSIGFTSFQKKQLFLLFPQKVEQVKKLFRENHQSKFKKEEDLVRTAELLNKLCD